MADSPGSPGLRWDLVFCKAGRRGRRREVGESTPRRMESATMALRGEERGDIRGPGIMRDMELRDRVDGRSVFWLGSRRELCPGGGGGPDRCASDGSRGEEMVFSAILGLADGSNRFSEDRHGLSNKGDSSPSSFVPSGVAENAADRGVRGSESVCLWDDLLDWVDVCPPSYDM